MRAHVLGGNTTTSIPNQQCLGLSSDFDCCTASNPCDIGEGDCEVGKGECAAGLICGNDNCRDFRSNAEATADCCIKPKPVPGI